MQKIDTMGDGLPKPPKPVPDAALVTIKVQFEIRKHGGRKLILAPGGTPMQPMVAHVDSALVKAIARAFRWKKMLETGLTRRSRNCQR